MNKTLPILMRPRLITARRGLMSSGSRHSRSRVVLFGAVGTIFWLGTFAVFYRVLSYFQSVEDFGNILAMDDQTLLVIAFNATITLLVLAVIFRPLVIECVDPVFLRTVSRAGAPAHLAFLALVVINLVNGFHALGTLLAVGLMILPAGIARFWAGPGAG